MLDWLASVLQFVITWSQFLGLLTAPIALVLLAIAAISKRRAINVLPWFLVLLWPWTLYVGAVGLALCFSAFGQLGWLAVIVAPILIVVFGVNAAWAGVLIAFVSGSWSLGAYLAAICVGLMALKMATLLLAARAESAVVAGEPQAN